MASKQSSYSCIVRFGREFELDFGAYEVRRAGKSLKLARIPMELLLLLVEQRGHLVTREQIVERVWGKNVYLDTDNSINAVIRRIRIVLEDDPDEPRFIQTVVGRGYRFIATIDEDGAQPSAVLDAKAQLSAPTVALEAAVPGRTPMRMRVGAILLVLLVLLGMEFSGIRERLFRGALAVNAAKPVRVRQSVAVLSFKNLSGKADQAWISTALEEMFSSELAAGQQLRIVPSEDVDSMKLDSPLPATDTYSRETLGKVRKRLNADVVVLGSYFGRGDDTKGKIRIDLQLQDTRTGETIAVISREGKASELTDLVSNGGAMLRGKLGIGNVSVSDARLAVASAPANIDAARLYAQGLAKLRSFDALSARDFLLQAVATDPNHAPAHAALSECWSALGYDQKALDEAKEAFHLSSNLSREEQLSIEGQYRVAAHEWPRAIEIYRMLWEFFPDNSDYGLGLAQVQTSAGLGKDAMATVDLLSKRSPRNDHDPRIDLAESAAAHVTGDLRREEATGGSAQREGRAEGARMVVARALLIRGSTLDALGNSSGAIPILKEAEAVYSAVGDKRGVARVLNDLGIIERHQANLTDAQKFLEESLKISRETGSRIGMLQALTNLGTLFWDQGDIARTLDTYLQALNLSREIGDKDREATALGNIAGVLVLQGKLAEARQMNDQALQLDNETGDREGVGMILGNIADLLTRQGELSAARKEAEDALTIDRQVGNKSLEGYALYQLGSVLVSQGDVAAGRSKHEESAALRRTLGEKVTEGESQLALAQLQFDTGDAAAAESEARRLVPVFHAGSAIDDEALSHSLVALALSAQGRSAEAQQASAKASALSSKTLDLAVRLQIEIEQAYATELLSSAVDSPKNPGPTTGVSRALENAGEKAKRFGYVGLEFEARLRLAELELQSGKAGSGRAHLKLLQHDAQAKGFLLLSRKASRVLLADTLKTHKRG